MSLLMVLGIWIAASAVLTPVVGYLLSGAAQRRAAERRARKEIDDRLHAGTQPPA